MPYILPRQSTSRKRRMLSFAEQLWSCHGSMFPLWMILAKIKLSYGCLQKMTIIQLIKIVLLNDKCISTIQKQIYRFFTKVSKLYDIGGLKCFIFRNLEATIRWKGYCTSNNNFQNAIYFHCKYIVISTLLIIITSGRRTNVNGKILLSLVKKIFK